MSGQQGAVKARPGMMGAIMMAQADRYDWTKRPKNRGFRKWLMEDGPQDPKFKQILCNFLCIRWFCYQQVAFFRRYDFYRTVPPKLLKWYKIKNPLMFASAIFSFMALAFASLATAGDHWTIIRNTTLEFQAPYYPIDMHFGMYRACRTVAPPYLPNATAAAFGENLNDMTDDRRAKWLAGAPDGIQELPEGVPEKRVQQDLVAFQQNGCYDIHDPKGVCKILDDTEGATCLQLIEDSPKRLECEALLKLCTGFGTNIGRIFWLCNVMFGCSGFFMLMLAFEVIGISVEDPRFSGDHRVFRRYRVRRLAVLILFVRSFCWTGALLAVIAFGTWSQIGGLMIKAIKLQGVDGQSGQSYEWARATWIMAVAAAAIVVKHCNDFLRATKDQVRVQLMRASAADYMVSVQHFKEEAERKMDATAAAEQRIIAMAEVNTKLITALKVETSTLDQFKECFDKIDADGSGVIDTDETEAFLEEVLGQGNVTPAIISEFLNKFDKDNDHCIDWEEFQQGIEQLKAEGQELKLKLRKAHKTVKEFKRKTKRGTMMRMLKVDQLSTEDFRAAFQAIDEDGSGVIDSGEVKTLMQEMLQAPPPKSAIKSFIKEFDRDGDGEISWDEFEAGILQMKKDFEEEEMEAAMSNSESEEEMMGEDSVKVPTTAPVERERHKSTKTLVERDALRTSARERTEAVLKRSAAEASFRAPPPLLNLRLLEQPSGWDLPPAMILVLDARSVRVVDAGLLDGDGITPGSVTIDDVRAGRGNAAVADVWDWRSALPWEPGATDDPNQCVCQWQAESDSEFTVHLVHENAPRAKPDVVVIESVDGCADEMAEAFELCSLALADDGQEKTEEETYKRKTVRKTEEETYARLYQNVQAKAGKNTIKPKGGPKRGAGKDKVRRQRKKAGAKTRSSASSTGSSADAVSEMRGKRLVV